MTRDRLKFVYCVGTTPGEPVKIGLTGDPQGRLSGIQAHNWRDMRLFWAVWGTRTDERALLRSADRIRGEWVRDPDGKIAGMFTSDIFTGHFVSPMRAAMSLYMTHECNHPVFAGRDFKAMARVHSAPLSVISEIRDWCAENDRQMPPIHICPTRDFTVWPTPQAEAS